MKKNFDKIIINKHKENLTKFYKSRGISDTWIRKAVNMKLNRLDYSYGSERYIDWMEELLKYLENCFGEVKSILDLGCGTGEFVAIINKLGYKCDGADIYKEELLIANKLLIETGSNDTRFDDLDKLLLEEYDTVLMLSVVEHLDQNVFLEILKKLKRSGVKRIFILVPNKYKIIDDHTGLPFLGIIPRKLALLVLKVLNVKYELSETRSWDVWYRSPIEIENLAQHIGYKASSIPDEFIYPPLKNVEKISNIKSRKIIKKIIHKIYIIFYLRMQKYHKLNDYPYINIVLSA
jgi:2-polyprenyl-3-methyl-5-hydroxy-6-metoxy-1,4-benzoquinol methylase